MKLTEPTVTCKHYVNKEGDLTIRLTQTYDRFLELSRILLATRYWEDGNVDAKISTNTDNVTVLPKNWIFF